MAVTFQELKKETVYLDEAGNAWRKIKPKEAKANANAKKFAVDGVLAWFIPYVKQQAPAATVAK